VLILELYKCIVPSVEKTASGLFILINSHGYRLLLIFGEQGSNDLNLPKTVLYFE